MRESESPNTLVVTAVDGDAPCRTIFLSGGGYAIELRFWFAMVADETYSPSRIALSVKQIR